MTEENEFPIPLSWKEYFGEEKFFDIFVYTQYGGRTPLEALKILNLEAPPEKKSEPRQESAEKLATVVKPQTEPKQQSDVEKTVKQEVKMEAKVEKDNFFPKTTAQEKERGGKDFFPSMANQPETIEIPTKTSFKGGGSGRASMPINQFPDFVLRRLETAFTWGDLSETLKYYTSVGDGGQIFDRRTIGDLKRLGKDYDDAKTLDERKSIFKGISEYLRGMKTQRG